MLNALIKYTRCTSWVQRPQIDALFKLINKLDLESYNYNEELQIRIRLIKYICDGMIVQNITDSDVLEMYVHNNVPDGNLIMANVGFEENRLNKSECDTIEKAIAERLQYSYLYSFKNTILELYDVLDKPNFTEYAESIFKLKQALSNLMINLQAVGGTDDLIKEFNFSGYLYDAMMNKIVARAKKDSTILFTGMRCLNSMLSPGFEGGRLYVFLGGTGKGKSGALLNITDQLRKFNPQLKALVNGIRKTVVFVTLENTINETIERLFDMYNDTGIPLKQLDAEEVKRILRENGKFTFTDEDGIDLDIFYYSDLEISTADLYQLMFQLRDLGKDPIALVLDYILKIDSTRDNQNDERIRLTYCAKELKSFAQVFDIPVITAMQFNREGNTIIDAATRDEREGILNLVGPGMIGTAWGLVQEADWVGAINLERRISINTVNMTFKLYKIRGKRDNMTIDYFNHPFENNSLRLMTDVDKDKTVSAVYQASDLASVDDDDDVRSNNTQKRPSIKTYNASNPTPDVAVINRMSFGDFQRIA